MIRYVIQTKWRTRDTLIPKYSRKSDEKPDLKTNEVSKLYRGGSNFKHNEFDSIFELNVFQRPVEKCLRSPNCLCSIDAICQESFPRCFEALHAIQKEV